VTIIIAVVGAVILTFLLRLLTGRASLTLFLQLKGGSDSSEPPLLSALHCSACVSHVLPYCFFYSSLVSALRLSLHWRRQPNSIYQGRREALARELHGGVALLFGNYEPPMEYQDYRQDEDFYYLTGWSEPGAALIVADAVPARARKNRLCPMAKYFSCPERNLRDELFTGIKT